MSDFDFTKLVEGMTPSVPELEFPDTAPSNEELANLARKRLYALLKYPTLVPDADVTDLNYLIKSLEGAGYD